MNEINPRPKRDPRPHPQYTHYIGNYCW